MANESSKELRRLYWKAKEGRSVDKETNQVLYSLFSLRGTNLRGLFESRVISYVFFTPNGLKILTKPNRFNKLPAVNYSDIANVDITTKRCGYSLWLLKNRIIVITSKYGPQTKLYTRSQKQAEMFVNELKAKMREASGEQPAQNAQDQQSELL
ncbi:MAG: hypothetical protein LUF26_05670 [Firmicutes bacterium]|nr:hypothetical protein [Bacillota bacterium]